MPRAGLYSSAKDKETGGFNAHATSGVHCDITE